jgi:hypothetical protein
LHQRCAPFAGCYQGIHGIRWGLDLLRQQPVPFVGRNPSDDPPICEQCAEEFGYENEET